MKRACLNMVLIQHPIDPPWEKHYSIYTGLGLSLLPSSWHAIVLCLHLLRFIQSTNPKVHGIDCKVTRFVHRTPSNRGSHWLTWSTCQSVPGTES